MVQYGDVWYSMVIFVIAYNSTSWWMVECYGVWYSSDWRGDSVQCRSGGVIDGVYCFDGDV